MNVFFRVIFLAVYLFPASCCLGQINSIGEDLFHVGVKVMILNSAQEVLMLKAERKDKTYWEFPGGRIKVGENSEAAALREVAEETGIAHLKGMRHIGMMVSSIRIPLESASVGLIFSFYKASVDSDLVILSHEHSEYEWMPLEKAEQLLVKSYGEQIINLISSVDK